VAVTGSGPVMLSVTFATPNVSLVVPLIKNGSELLPIKLPFAGSSIVITGFVVSIVMILVSVLFVCPALSLRDIK